MTYVPTPLDTSSVVIDPSVEELVDRLAAHLHELWSKRRMDDGWRFGPKRDDDQKTHPCLVPYEDLPISERAYDRASAEGTIRALLAMGYRIERG